MHFLIFLQVLEGALEGTKAMLASSEKDKLSLEAQIQQLMVEAARSDAEHTKKIEGCSFLSIMIQPFQISHQEIKIHVVQERVKPLWYLFRFEL